MLAVENNGQKQADLMQESDMEKEHFVETGRNSFSGDYLYDQIVPEDHFLRKLKQQIPWERFTLRFVKLCNDGGMYGSQPFDPALILKMEIIAYLYHLSEREVEIFINENIPAKFFVGLALDQKAPDHSTLRAFHERLLTQGKLEVFKEILDEMIQIARDNGVQFGTIETINSVENVKNS